MKTQNYQNNPIPKITKPFFYFIFSCNYYGIKKEKSI